MILRAAIHMLACACTWQRLRKLRLKIMKKILKSFLKGSVIISIILISSVFLFAGVLLLEPEQVPFGNCYEPPDGCQ